MAATLYCNSKNCKRIKALRLFLFFAWIVISTVGSWFMTRKTIDVTESTIASNTQPQARRDYTPIGLIQANSKKARKKPSTK